MPLAAVTNLAVSRLHRINNNSSLDYFADVSWTNNEASNHFVVVALNVPSYGKSVPTTYTLPRGATKLDRAALFSFLASQPNNEATISLSVQLKSATEESTATSISQTVAISDTAQLVGNFAYDGQGGLDFPTFSGVVEVDGNYIWADVSYETLGDSSFGIWDGIVKLPKELSWNQVKFTREQLAFYLNYIPWQYPPWVSGGGLQDGNFYRATATFRISKTPNRQNNQWVNSFSTVTRSIAFEYYKDGPAVPVFTSSLDVDVYVDNAFSYTPTATGALSFSANLGTNANLSFGTSNNTVSGTFSQTGKFSFSITATNQYGNTTKTISVTVKPFTALGQNATAVRNSEVRLLLQSSHRATWSINSGAPQGFAIDYFPPNFGTAVGPDQAYLVGTPIATGSFSISLTASRSGASPAQTSTATVTLTVAEALAATTINASADAVRNGLSAAVGQNISLALSSVPSPATWTADGLPPGISISQAGLISGSATEQGTFFAAITARAEGRETSSAVNIKFTITPAVAAAPAGATAADRSPWLLEQWELTDLHVRARSRQVDSTLLEDGAALRIKLGDAINFAVFFVDQNSAVFALAPTQLRLTIRKADNLDDLIIFKSAAPPQSATTQSQTYYLMPVTTGNREREVALEWAEENGKNEPLECVADIDWIKDGKLYSSRTFPVLLELDVTRP